MSELLGHLVYIYTAEFKAQENVIILVIFFFFFDNFVLLLLFSIKMYVVALIRKSSLSNSKCRCRSKEMIQSHFILSLK